VLVPSDKGRFEVFVDDEQVQTGTFPEAREIVKAIEARMKKS
jgi:predicted Rdx family selenoprotein